MNLYVNVLQSIVMYSVHVHMYLYMVHFTLDILYISLPLSLPPSFPPSFSLSLSLSLSLLPIGCPANEVNEEGQTPQKLAKADGIKDAMKELKKLTGYQDKVAKGGKPKGFAELWCIRVRHIAMVLP